LATRDRVRIFRVLKKLKIKVMKINVNTTNSKVIDGKLFITGLKMSQLKAKLAEYIIKGSTVKHPTLGMMYEYDGPFSRK